MLADADEDEEADADEDEEADADEDEEADADEDEEADAEEDEEADAASLGAAALFALCCAYPFHIAYSLYALSRTLSSVAFPFSSFNILPKPVAFNNSNPADEAGGRRSQGAQRTEDLRGGVHMVV
jgi:hypothetical protein